jgi:hypothetical protein
MVSVNGRKLSRVKTSDRPNTLPVSLVLIPERMRMFHIKGFLERSINICKLESQRSP